MRSWNPSVLVIVACAAGCLSQPYDPDGGYGSAPPSDLAGRDLVVVDLFGADLVPIDLATLDLAGIDLGAPDDLAPHGDLGSVHDLASPGDLAGARDLSGPQDFSISPADLATSTDLASPRDLSSVPPDLSSPGDLATNPDLSQPQTCQQCLQGCSADTSACLSDPSCLDTLECAVESSCLMQDPASPGFASCIDACLESEGLTFQQQLQVFEELSTLAVCYSSCTTSCGG